MTRIYLFFFVCIMIALWEYFSKAKLSKTPPRHSSKYANLLLLISSIGLNRIVFPGGLLIIAERIQAQGQSLLGLYDLELLIQAPLTIIIFDFCIYWQHRLSHKIPFLWRFHKVHHSDKGMDLTTGLRFHPGEIVFSNLFKLTLIMIIGPDPTLYICYEVILNSMSIFNHGNIHITESVNKYLCKLIVTPKFHLPHHSSKKTHTNSNYGNFLVLWDYLFKSYKEHGGHVTLGLNDTNKEQASSFKQMLLAPFKS